jgi:hypothetical protein
MIDVCEIGFHHWLGRYSLVTGILILTSFQPHLKAAAVDSEESHLHPS